MINCHFRKLAMRLPRCARGLVLAGVPTLLLLGVISCGTVSRSVVVLPEVPGAKYIGAKECDQCHDEIYKGFRHGRSRPLDRSGDQRAGRRLRILPWAVQPPFGFRRRGLASL